MRRLIVIDKLELRVPDTTRFSDEFEDLRSSWQYEMNPSRFYLGVRDLREFDYPCMLHFRHRHTGNHKLELIDTSSFSFSSMIDVIESIFEVDPMILEIMRLDLAADMEGVPVHAFVGNVRGKWKRSSADIGRYTRMGKLGVESFYLGKRPNLVRVYNKIAELEAQYAVLKRRMNGDSPPFEQIYRYPRTGLILTRVERQMGGGRIPERIGTVGKLRGLSEFDPFDRLEIVAGSDVPPSAEEGSFSTYLKGLGLRQLVLEHGLQNARRLANRLSSGNASKLFKEYADYLPSSGFQITGYDIFEKYRESVSKQLAA
jgi:hypothetical protein